jgi:hypothetical protein
LGTESGQKNLMNSRDDKPWRILLTEEKFEELRNDPQFHSYLRLARCANAMFFFHQTLINADEQIYPCNERHTTNSFLYLCAVLYEGWNLIDDARKQFGELDSFKNGLGNLQGNKKMRKMKDAFVRDARRKTAFHFDEQVVREVLENEEASEYSLVIGRGPSSGLAYYDFADKVFMKYVFPGNVGESEVEYRSYLSGALREISDLLSIFTNAIQDLLVEVTQLWNLEGEEIPE